MKELESVVTEDGWLPSLNFERTGHARDSRARNRRASVRVFTQESIALQWLFSIQARTSPAQ